jgi:hypothetical protein
LEYGIDNQIKIILPGIISIVAMPFAGCIFLYIDKILISTMHSNMRDEYEYESKQGVYI